MGLGTGRLQVGGRIQAPTIRAPRVNQGAGQVAFTPMPVPKIQNDGLTTALVAGGDFSAQLVKSAFQYQQRQDQVIADFNVLELDKELRDSYYGKPDASGQVQGGYGNTKELAASQGYGGFQKGVAETIATRLSQMTPQQQQYAVQRMHQTGNSYLNKAATHASTQLGKAEESARNQGFNQAMENTQRDLAEGKPIDLGMMQNSLAKFTDPSARKTRDTEMTKMALNGTLLTQGPLAALNLAEELTLTPGVGDPTTVQEFINTLKNNQQSDESHKWAKIRFQEEQRKNKITKNNQAVDAAVQDNLAPSIMNGGFGKVIKTADAMYSPEVRRDKVVNSINDSIGQQWENATTLNPVGGAATVEKALMGQLQDVPEQYRDDVVRRIEELKKKDREKHLDVLKGEDELHKANIALEQNLVTDSIASAQEYLDNGGRRTDPWFQDQLKMLGEEPSITDQQRTKLNRLATGDTNPLEGQELLEIENNWQDIVTDPAMLQNYDISDTKMRELTKRLTTDRTTAAAPQRSAGVGELKRWFSVEDVGAGGIRATKLAQTIGAGSNALSEDQALAAYNTALQRYHSIVDGELRLDRNNTPGEAVQKALNSILGDESLRASMNGLPTTTKGIGTDIKPKTYLDDHSIALKLWNIPSLGGLDGPANIVEFAHQTARDYEEGGRAVPEGMSPKTIILERINEVYSYLNMMSKQANTPEQAMAVQQMIKNHTGQSMYLMQLRPAGDIEYSAPERVNRKTSDADNVVTESRGNTRLPELAAGEMDTQEGVVQKDRMDRLYKAVSADGVYRVHYGKDQYGKPLDRYGRPLGSPRFGRTDVQATAIDEGIVDPFYKE